MAQEGDTITYVYSDGKSVSEDVSNVDEAVVDYCDGPGGQTNAASGGAGGRVENATIDVSNESTLYIWVGTGRGTTSDSNEPGRYPTGLFYPGTSEVSLFDTNSNDSEDEPFLVGSGGGGGGGEGSFGNGGDGAARGGDGGSGDVLGVSGTSSDSTPPPAGGDGGDAGDSPTAGTDGDGAIDDQNRGLVSGGSTIKGGGTPPSSDGSDGEIQITYQSALSPPDAPSNLTAEVQ